jgi:hypothetical protein
MISPDEATAARDAIAVMTAWVSEEAGTEFVNETLARVADDRYPGDSGLGFAHMAVGLVTLCGVLLLWRQADTGQPPEVSLQELGRRWAIKG